MSFLLLPRQRKAVRAIARDEFLRHNATSGDDARDAAILAATQRIKDELVGSILLAILLGVAVRLAIELIVYWFKEFIVMPPEHACDGEPGYEGGSADV